MTELQPGDQVRVVVDATIVRATPDTLAFEINQPGTAWRRLIRDLDGVDVRPADSSRYEFAVAHGLSDDPGAGPEDAAGSEIYDDEAAACEDAQWRIESGVFRRRVDVGAWEPLPAEAEESDV